LRRAAAISNLPPSQRVQSAIFTLTGDLMAELLVGLDVGTTATKALLFDLDGRVLAVASRGYGLLTPGLGCVEQDPEQIWAAVVETLQSLSQAVGRRPGGQNDRIVALSQSSQGGTTIPVEAQGRPLHAAFSWMDQRAAEEAAAVEARWGADAIYRTTGWSLFGGLPLQHIAWFRRNRPAEFSATAHFLFVNDFIGYRLTGQRCMNPSDAGITQLMALATGDWDTRLLETAGVHRDQLSPVRPSGAVIGTLTAQAAEATGLPRDTLVVNGAHDQYCAAVGAGVTRPGRVLLSCGTAWVLLAVPPDLERGLGSRMAISRHAVEGRWGAIRSLGGVGSSLEWLVDNTYGGHPGGAGYTGSERATLYAALNDAAGQTPPGSDGLLFLPLAGGHAANYGPARGGFLNLSLNHSRGHLGRAVMEGTAFELRWAVEETRAAGVGVTALTMVGGAAKSPVWPRIVADVLGVPVTIPAEKDAAARGAAILAGVGAGLLENAEAGFAAWSGDETSLEPAPAHQPVIDAAYARYQAAVQTLATIRG
jgi:xylulokinase